MSGKAGPEDWVKLPASFFYVGYLPWMPGTWGSLAGFALAWFFNPRLFWMFLGFSLAGFLIAAPAERAFGKKDPQNFVLDEVVGMMLSVLWLPRTPALFIAAFILFRILDTLKPGPIGWIQKRETPSGILWDDLAAGAAVNLILQFILSASVLFR